MYPRSVVLACTGTPRFASPLDRAAQGYLETYMLVRKERGSAGAHQNQVLYAFTPCCGFGGLI